MTVEEMHYDFKVKLNKVDSQRNRNLTIPNIDWKLNEAQELFVQETLRLRLNNELGFEKTQQGMDAVRTIVVSGYDIAVIDKVAPLPDDYWHFISGTANFQKQGCSDRTGIIKTQEINTLYNRSSFDKSSYEWGEVTSVFEGNNLVLSPSVSFNINEVTINYIRRPRRIHNAKDYKAGSYTALDGTVLTGSADCELPEHVHRKIVDIAVFSTVSDLNAGDITTIINKLNYNTLK